MEKEVTKPQKFYTKGWILVSSYLGGPLAGCYLLGKNFQTLGKKEAAKKTFIIGIIGSLLLGILAYIPEGIIDKIPNSAIPLAYSLAIFYYAKQLQEKEIDPLLEKGANKYSGWRAIGIGLLTLIVTVVYFFLLPLP